jgi:hypothetical protein
VERKSEIPLPDQDETRPVEWVRRTRLARDSSLCAVEGRRGFFPILQGAIEVLYQFGRCQIVHRPEGGQDHLCTCAQKGAGEALHSFSGKDSPARRMAAGEDDELDRQLPGGDLGSMQDHRLGVRHLSRLEMNR